MNFLAQFLKMIKIISGAQTGADVAGLWAAKLFGIPTSGYAPNGFLTLDGNHPEMAVTFDIKEHQKSGYRDRTIDNLKSSNSTIVCSEKMSAGTRLTINQCAKAHKVYWLFQLDPSNMDETLNLHFNSDKFRKLVNSIRISIDMGIPYTLNVAGNSTKNSQRIFEFTFKMCCRLFTELGYETTNDLTNWKQYQDKWK